jgi:hypothetical protein
MQRGLTLAAIILVGVLAIEERAAAQSVPEVESETPAAGGAPSASAPFVVTEPRGSAPPTLKFDPSELRLAEDGVLRTRNWFLLSSGVLAFGWIFLGVGISQCEWINDVALCTRTGDATWGIGATFVVFGTVSVIATSIIYGVRSGQKKKLELQTLRHLTEGGRRLPPASFDRYRLTDAESRIRRARNGLIGSAALFGLGWIFLGVAIPRCQSGVSELLCSSAGYAHLTVGITLTGAGAIGTIVSGVLLGVRKRNSRALRRSIGPRQGTGFRWDPQSGSFVF